MHNRNPFPKRLQQARSQAGISQKELGIRVGIEPSSASGRMNHYEKGRHMPDFEIIEKLAKELDKPIAFFFCEKDSLAELMCVLEHMSEDQRQILLERLKKDLSS